MAEVPIIRSLRKNMYSKYISRVMWWPPEENTVKGVIITERLSRAATFIFSLATPIDIMSAFGLVEPPNTIVATTVGEQKQQVQHPCEEKML